MQIDPNKYYYHEKYKLLTPVSGYILTDQNSLYGLPEKDFVSYDDDETMTASDYPINSTVYIVPWRMLGVVKSYSAQNKLVNVEILDGNSAGHTYSFAPHLLTKQNESRNRKDFKIGKKIFYIRHGSNKIVCESFGFLQNMYFI